METMPMWVFTSRDKVAHSEPGDREAVDSAPNLSHVHASHWVTNNSLASCSLSSAVGASPHTPSCGPDTPAARSPCRLAHLRREPAAPGRAGHREARAAGARCGRVSAFSCLSFWSGRGSSTRPLCPHGLCALTKPHARLWEGISAQKLLQEAETSGGGRLGATSWLNAGAQSKGQERSAGQDPPGQQRTPPHPGGDCSRPCDVLH